jgi:hypothetical protein
MSMGSPVDSDVNPAERASMSRGAEADREDREAGGFAQVLAPPKRGILQ